MSHKAAKAFRTGNIERQLVVMRREQRQRSAHQLADRSKPHNRPKKTKRQCKIKRAKDLLKYGNVINWLVSLLD